MGRAENAKKILTAAVAFALIVALLAAASWAGTGSASDPAPFAPVFDAGRQLDNGPATGRLKIIKNLGGSWTADSFIFTWDCKHANESVGSGSATFTGDFTGANYTVADEFPIGTVCWVMETDGTLKVSDYNVTTHIESAAGFQAINGRNVPIDNSEGQNTIQFQNDPIEPCDPYFNNCRPETG